MVGPHFGVFRERRERGTEDIDCGVVLRPADPVVHPLALAAGGYNSGAAQIGQMAGDLGLRLAEDFNEVADADLASGHEVEQAETGGIGERGKEASEIKAPGGSLHSNIIYVLTDILQEEYIC